MPREGGLPPFLQRSICYSKDSVHFVSKTSIAITYLWAIREAKNKFYGDIYRNIDTETTGSFDCEGVVIHLRTSNLPAHGNLGLLHVGGAVVSVFLGLFEQQPPGTLLWNS